MSSNPYRKPTAGLKRVRNDDDVLPRSKEVLLFPGLILLTAFCGSWMAPLIINWFEKLFDRFEGELPGITQFILATRHGWIIFLVVAVALTFWIARPKEQTRRQLRAKNRAMIVFAIVFGVAVTVAYYALYLPLIKMAKVI
jgi:type II secretory pathway component PulF